MKKLVLLFIGVLAMPTVYAQDITDAVRYSTENVQGTARFRAMSGAFGALGGDMSAVSINPAGSAIFNNSHASFSVSSMDAENNTSFFNNSNSATNSNFDFNQAGAAFVFENTNANNPWSKFVIGFSYERTGNYDNQWFASGTNTNSIGSYFLANAQGTELSVFSPSFVEVADYFVINQIDPLVTAEELENNSSLYYDYAYQFLGEVENFQQQQAFLGYESFILEPDADDDANTVYTSNIAPGTFNQEYSYVSTGYNGKISVNLAAQYQDNLYLGLNLNSHFINFDRSTYLFEENSNVGSFVNEVAFENTLSTVGNGFSFQLGGIAKLNDVVRVGLAYDSPTWYTISEETTQYIGTTLDDPDPFVDINPQVVNVYPDYKLQTPAKITGSIALILNKQGLISFDYSRKDYGNAKFTPKSDAYFATQNTVITNDLKAANTYRIGGEMRHENFSFRGGYKLEESPYNDTSFYGDLKGYSLGIGYNFGGTKLDLAYENSKRDINHQLYSVGLTDAATIASENSNVTLSLSMSL